MMSEWRNQTFAEIGRVFNGNSINEREKKAHFELVAPLSIEADVLDISACLGDPLVLRVEGGTTFTVRNKDSKEHTIQISEKLQFTVSPGKTKEIKADFGFGRGVYGYGCDNSPSAAGIFFVI
jgi:plastocyanin